jgi:hypothetical protein
MVQELVKDTVRLNLQSTPRIAFIAYRDYGGAVRMYLTKITNDNNLHYLLIIYLFIFSKSCGCGAVYTGC